MFLKKEYSSATECGTAPLQSVFAHMAELSKKILSKYTPVFLKNTEFFEKICFNRNISLSLALWLTVTFNL